MIYQYLYGTTITNQKYKSDIKFLKNDHYLYITHIAYKNMKTTLNKYHYTSKLYSNNIKQINTHPKKSHQKQQNSPSPNQQLSQIPQTNSTQPQITLLNPNQPPSISNPNCSDKPPNINPSPYHSYNNYNNVYQIMKINQSSITQQQHIRKLFNGRWTKTQQQRFFKGLQRFGKDWVRIQKIVKTRTLTQIRSHAQKIFLKMSENDIQTLLSQPYQNQATNSDNSPNLKPTTKNNLKTTVQITLNHKSSPKPEIDLVDIFMKAIQNEQKEQAFQFQHTAFSELQSSEKDEETIMKQDDISRNQCKGEKIFLEKDNHQITETHQQSISPLSEAPSLIVLPFIINLNLSNEQKHN